MVGCHAGRVLEILSGTGLATASGLNAAVPLLALAAADRWTTLVDLPADWAWIAEPWAMVVLGILLVVEVVADKVPGLDSVNDVVQTVVRPAAGGLAFAAGSGSTTVAVREPAELFSSGSWLPVIAGVLMALTVHVAKAVVRPVVNVATLGVGAPVVSAAEDATSVALVVAAVLLPLLVLVLVAWLVWVWVRLRRRRRTTATAPSPGRTL